MLTHYLMKLSGSQLTADLFFTKSIFRYERPAIMMTGPYFNTLQHGYRRAPSATHHFTPRSPPHYAIPARPPLARDTNYGIMHHSLYVGGFSTQTETPMFQSSQYYTQTTGEPSRGNIHCYSTILRTVTKKHSPFFSFRFLRRHSLAWFVVNWYFCKIPRDRMFYTIVIIAVLYPPCTHKRKAIFDFCLCNFFFWHFV